MGCVLNLLSCRTVETAHGGCAAGSLGLFIFRRGCGVRWEACPGSSIWAGQGLLARWTHFSGCWTLLCPSVTSSAPCFSILLTYLGIVLHSGPCTSCVVLNLCCLTALSL